VSQKTVANLGWDDVTLSTPVFHGDTIHAESEVIAKRESNSRPEDGIVTVETTGNKQTGETVVEFERTMLIPKRDPDDSTSE